MVNYISYNQLYRKSKPRIKRWLARHRYNHRSLPEVRLVLGPNVFIKKNHIKCKDIKPHRRRRWRPTNITLHRRKEYKKYWISFKQSYFNRVISILDYFEFERDFFRRIMYREWYHHTFLNMLAHGLMHWAFWVWFIIVYLFIRKIFRLSRKYKTRSILIYISSCFLFYYTFDIEKHPLIKQFFIIIGQDDVLSSIWN